MVQKINNSQGENLINNKYFIYNNDDKILSKMFHLINNTSKIIEGQMLSSMHYTASVPIDKDITYVIKSLDMLKNNENGYYITIPKNKLKTAYNKIIDQYKDLNQVFNTTINQPIENDKYVIYLQFEVNLNQNINNNILLTLPSFRIEYLN